MQSKESVIKDMKDERQQELSSVAAQIAYVQNELPKQLHKLNPKEVRWVQTKRTDEIETLLQKTPVHKRSAKSEMIDCCVRYWNSMSIDWKKEFLRIRVCDLKFHFGRSNDTLPNDFVYAKANHTWKVDSIAQALSYAKANNKWKVWLCCHCHETFSDSESHRQHVMDKHVGNLPPEMHKLLPQNVDEQWTNQILYICSWKPLDASASVVMLENQAKCKDFSFPRNWPLSDDAERATLGRILGGLYALIRHKYLASSHLGKVVKFAMDEIPRLATASRVKNIPLDQSPTGICFLGALQLKKILKFLHELSRVCGLVKISDKSTKLMYDEIQEKIFLSEDASCLLLDECLVPAESTPSAYGSAHNTDRFLSWIFSCYWDQLTLYLRTREDNKTQGLELVRTLKNEFDQLLNLSKKKFERTNYEEATSIQMVFKTDVFRYKVL